MKKSLIISLVVVSFFAFASVAFAFDETMMLANNTAQNCRALFGDPNKAGDFAYYLQIILNVIKYAGIVLCIVLTVVDFFKALLGDDKELYKPLTKKMFARFFYAVALFFLPTIVKALLTLIDVYGTCNIS